MISVIMPVYLGDYPGAAKNRQQKFRRAINSFLSQGTGELIIVADGCNDAVEIFQKEYSQHLNIRCFLLKKQPLFSGNVRQQGIINASHKWICYLDSDDEFNCGHLLSITNQITDQHDWFYYDDYIFDGISKTLRSNTVQFSRIGTSSIVHKNSLSAVWGDGYGHDFKFICQLGQNFKKINNCGYQVNHIPGKFDN